MNFNIHAFLRCFELHELDYQINTYEDKGLTISFSITEDEIIVDRFITNEYGNSEVRTVYLPVPDSFDEAIRLFRENDLGFLDICNSRESLENIKEEYESYCHASSFSYVSY